MYQMKNKLIVFEGTDGCGKTTQMQLCYEWMQGLGLPVVTTREPGGTELGKDLREILLNKSLYKIAELFLYLADRAQHIQEVIVPNLMEGKYVLCDRYIDSTFAYQGYGRDIDPSFIFELNNLATNGLKAGMTVWINVDVEVGLRRKATRRNLDRIEKEDINFHLRIQKAYNFLYKLKRHPIIQVDGNRKKEDVQAIIQHHLKQYLV